MAKVIAVVLVGFSMFVGGCASQVQKQGDRIPATSRTAHLVQVDEKEEGRQKKVFEKKLRGLNDEVVLCTCKSMNNMIDEEDRAYVGENGLMGGLGYVSLASIVDDPTYVRYPTAGCKITIWYAKVTKTFMCYDYVTIK